jgi:dienelactone hydrolase
MMKYSITKERVKFLSDGTSCTGYLYLPESTKSPCVILCAGFGGTQDTPSLISTSEALASEGIAAFTFDYRSFGESGGEPRQVMEIDRELQDILAAVEMVKARKEVDSTRLGLWGSSLGGGHVITTAAKLKDIKAVVAQIPYNGFPKKAEGRSFWQSMRLLRAMYKDKRNREKGRPPVYIAAVGQLGELAVMTSNEAATTIAGMQSATWRNEIAPGGVFGMAKYKPGDYASQIKAHVLVCYGERDKEAQVPQTLELIKNLTHVEVKAYPVAHFDFYKPEIREGIIAEQLQFYKKYLFA